MEVCTIYIRSLSNPAIYIYSPTSSYYSVKIKTTLAKPLCHQMEIAFL